MKNPDTWPNESRVPKAAVPGQTVFAKTLADPLVVAVKWHLSSRHPVYDICDLYSAADMYNLGSGVYPKINCRRFLHIPTAYAG